MRVALDPKPLRRVDEAASLRAEAGVATEPPDGFQVPMLRPLAPPE